MVCKEDVVNWFHKLSGAARLEVLVTLLDICLPFEIRFLGTVMENLGRRDYHELRDVDHRANNFLHSTRNGTMNDKMALRTALMDTPMQLSSPCSNVNFPHTGLPPSAVIYNNVVSNSQQTTNPSSDVSFTSINRPSPNQHPDKLVGMRLSGANCQPSQQLPDGHQFQSGRQQQTGDGDSGGNNKGCITLNLQNSDSKEEKNDKSLLLDDVLRKRCILYISVLTATNRECASVYYQVLSEIKSLVEVNGWIEALDDDMVEEMALLYTISSNHPAFTFDQRRNLSEYANKFLQMLSKSEPPKVTPQPTQFIATPVPGVDQKFGQYYIQYVPHPMQWQNMSGSNGTVEEGNRIQTPVSFTIPPYAFPMYMPTHHHHPRSQAPIHPQVNPHQFSQNPLQPVQSTVSLSPQAQMGMNNHPHPPQLVQHSFQQNPFGTVTVGSHLQAPSHVSHAYTQSMNGQNILPVPSGIHAQPVGLQNPIPPIISSSISHQPQYQQQQAKAQQQQLSPQLPQPPGVVVGGAVRNNNIISTTGGNPTCVAVPTATFQSNSNSLDGNESEECVWDSPESSSPFQSPPQSLTPSRSQSPSSQPNQAHVITNQNQSCVVASHFNLSQPEMMSHNNSSSGGNNSSSNNTVPIATSITYSSSSQRSVCSTATSISPPPRSQKTSSSQKLSQNIQTRILPKHAQDIEVSMNNASLNNVNVPLSSVPPVSTSLGNCMTGKHINCVVSANNLNGIKPSTLPDRRSKSSVVTVTNLMNTNPIVTTTTSSCPSSSSSSVAVVNVSQCPGLIQTVPSATSCPSSYPTNVVSGSQNQVSTRRQQAPPPVRRQQPTNNVAAHHHPAPPTSVSSHYNLQHSQSIKNTNNIVASATNNLPQYSNNFTFPFSIPQYPSHQPQPSISTSNKGINNSTLTAASSVSKQITSQTPCNQNGGKINIISANDISLFGGHSCSQQQPNSHIHNGIKVVNHDCATTFNKPASLISSNLPSATQQLTKTSVVPPPSQSRGSRVLLEVGGGQDVLGRIDATIFGPLEDLVDPSGSRIKMSCYNCGAHSHFGPDCKESTMEEMTKHPYRINFLPEPSSQETKDTD